MKGIEVIVENKLVMEKRDLNVYHHATRSAHMISHGSSVTFPLMSALDDDYLHVSVVAGPGKLEQSCIVRVPSWVDFRLSSAGDATISRTDDWTCLTIPPGPPTWELKMTRAVTTAAPGGKTASSRITVGDENSGTGL